MKFKKIVFLACFLAAFFIVDVRADEISAEIPEVGINEDFEASYFDSDVLSELMKINEKLDLLTATPSEVLEDEVLESDEVEEEELHEVIPYVEEEDNGRSDFRSVSRTTNPAYRTYTNCLRYNVTISNVNYDLLFPAQYENFVYVDSNGYLWNVGSVTIQGLLVENNNLDPTADNGKILYLNSIFNNNFEISRNYGSINFLRRYSWKWERYRGTYLDYSDTYVKVKVNKYYYPFSVSNTLMYIIIFMLGGVFLLCWLKLYKRY